LSDDTLPLFPNAPFAAGGGGPAPGGQPAAPDPGRSAAPLAERMRPRTLDEIVGQEALVGEAGTLRRLLRGRRIPSLILHGPPGSGKTTLGRLLADELGAAFVPFSAVSEGVPRLREIVKEAERNRRDARKTLVFVDEIHRLNKGQQDFLLPFVESGLVTLVGATTEHPAFEVNAALLSRARVLVLQPLGEDALRALIRRALGDADRGLGAEQLVPDDDAEALLIEGAAGDARQALNTLEIAAQLVGREGVLSADAVREAYQQRTARYDASTAAQMLSAFHKSLRSSQASAALYWGMRIIEAGEDPLVLLRRLIAAAYEDVGLADPNAGIVATQAMQAYERLGAPEGYLPLANAVLYVASAPKSNRAYLALHAAGEAARRVPDAPVPLHLRNAHSRLMREWGYGKEYRYAHDYEDAYVDMECLPPDLAAERFYQPSDRGYERRIAEAMRARGQLEPGEET
jgi:putative ATPase